MPMPVVNSLGGLRTIPSSLKCGGTFVAPCEHGRQAARSPPRGRQPAAPGSVMSLPFRDVGGASQPQDVDGRPANYEINGVPFTDVRHCPPVQVYGTGLLSPSALVRRLDPEWWCG
jgi:hypothetical protein